MTNRIRFARMLPALAWMALIFFLSSQERVPSPIGFSSQLLAIAGHLISYGVLALLVDFAAGDAFPRSAKRFAAVVALCIVYGISDELHQSFVPGRHATVFDGVVDAIGAGLALLGSWQVRSVVGQGRLGRAEPGSTAVSGSD